MDNTKKKSMNLREDLNVYIEAFRQMPGFVYLLDNNGVLVACNHNLLQLLALETVDTTTVGAIYQIMVEHGYWNEDQAQLFKQSDINARVSGQSKTDQKELPVFDDKGNIIFFKSTRIPLIENSGKVSGLLVILSDITDQKHMAEQLETIKKELQTYNSKEIKENTHTPPVSAQTKPASAKNGSEQTVEKKHSTKPEYSPKILLIEDNTIAQQAAKSVLMSGNCLVDIVDNELTFNTIFQPGKYDLVFMDIGLENTSGYAFAKQLRKKEQGSGHKVPIIALTGFDPDLVSLDCGYYQMEGAIGKPLKLEQVRQLIQYYIHHIDIEVSDLKRSKTTS